MQRNTVNPQPHTACHIWEHNGANPRAGGEASRGFARETVNPLNREGMRFRGFTKEGFHTPAMTSRRATVSQSVG